jgi:hypothetical protein
MVEQSKRRVMSMSRYEELVEVARMAEKKRDERNTQVQNFISTFFKKLSDYCGMPLDRLKLMPWVEEEQVFRQ